MIVRHSLGRLRGDGAVAAWLRGAGWLFSSSLAERAAALIQTVLIARALHVENYGRYGLLFSTIAALTPIVSLQLPYSVIYFVSRFQASDPAKAGAIILLGRRLTLVTTALAMALVLLLAGPFPAIDSPEPGPAGFSGSLIVAEFASLAQAQEWAGADPYIAADVYRETSVKPFLKALPAA